MKVINANGEIIGEARTKKALAFKVVDSVELWKGQVSEEEFESAGIKCLDSKGNEFPFSELILLVNDERAKASEKHVFHEPHLHGCNTPHKVRKPWHRW